MAFQDQQITCRDCGNTFTWTASEQEFYRSKGFDNPPVRCPDCRAKRKQNMHGGGGDRGPRQSFDITCSKCGKPGTVPFQPKEGGKPVLCRDCFQQERQAA